MNHRIALFLVLVATVACRDKECTPEEFDGTLFGADESSSNTVSGTATWADSTEEGLLIAFGVENPEGTSYTGALSNGGLFDMPETCGTQMTFSISGVSAGDHVVFVGIQSDEGGDSGMIEYTAEGRSDVLTIDGSVSGVTVSVE